MTSAAPAPSTNPISALIALASGFFTNYKKLDASVLAGGGASLLVFFVGCALVAGGVAVPPISILGVHLVASSIPITMTMVAAAAPTVGHFVSTIVPPTMNQQINQFAAKIGASVDHVKEIIPILQASAVDQYPVGKNGESESDNTPPIKTNLTLKQ